MAGGFVVLGVVAASWTEFGSEPATVLSLDLGKTAQNLGMWKQKGWLLGDGEATPSTLMPISEGGTLQLIAKDDNGKPCISLGGTVCVGSARLRPDKYYICTITTKGSPVKLFLNEKETLAAAGDCYDWTETSGLFIPSVTGTASCLMSVSSFSWIEGVNIREFDNLADAVMAGFPNFRFPQKTIINNGDMENTTLFSADEKKFFIDKMKWVLSPGHPIGFGPQQNYSGQKFHLIEDKAISHSGKNCVSFTAMAGGEFSMYPRKSYVFSLYAKGAGKLSVSGLVYGGPEGGCLGGIGIAEWFVASLEWTPFSVVLKSIKASETLSMVAILPVFVTPDNSGEILVDDVSVYALEGADELLKITAGVKARLNETLNTKKDDEKIAQLITFLLKETDAFEMKIKNMKEFNDNELQSRIFAIDALVKQISSIIDFK